MEAVCLIFVCFQYVLRCFKYVLRCFLNEEIVVISAGKRFHHLGAAVTKARSPDAVLELCPQRIGLRDADIFMSVWFGSGVTVSDYPPVQVTPGGNLELVSSYPL